MVGVIVEAGRDNLPFLASAITFDVLLAAVPFLLIVVSLLSFTLQSAAEASGLDPIAQLESAIGTIIPVWPEQGIVPDLVRGVVERGRALGLIGFVLFLWFSTRLFAALRAGLREVFDLPQERGIIHGKLFDLVMVFVSSILFFFNIGITLLWNVAQAAGERSLDLSGRSVGVVETIYALVTAFLFIFMMFFLIYRYVPARWQPWRTAAIAAGFSAIGWEILKFGFSVYLTRFANFESIYGNLATVILVVLWLYYSSILFLLGGELAHLYEVRRRARGAEGAPA